MTEPSGLLAGVPIAVKDDQRVAGQVTTVGSRSYGPANAADSEGCAGCARRARSRSGSRTSPS